MYFVYIGHIKYRWKDLFEFPKDLRYISSKWGSHLVVPNLEKNTFQ